MKLTRVNNDVNGNPRYVVHFSKLLTVTELKAYEPNISYSIAVERAKDIGGKRYRGKDFGGGIVFQSYSTPELEGFIKQAVRDATLKGDIELSEEAPA
jgi:hypothetical protein